MARQDGNDWYLGSMTNWESRGLEIELNFLDAKTCFAHIFYDNLADPYSKINPLLYEEKQVTNVDKQQLNLASGGGCAIRFEGKN